MSYDEQKFLSFIRTSLSRAILPKCKLVGNMDPYLISNDDFFHIPWWLAISKGVSTLCNTSCITYCVEEMKVFNGLTASNQPTYGWVRQVRVTIVNAYFVIQGKTCNLNCLKLLCLGQPLVNGWCCVINSSVEPCGSRAGINLLMGLAGQAALIVKISNDIN